MHYKLIPFKLVKELSFHLSMLLPIQKLKNANSKNQKQLLLLTGKYLVSNACVRLIMHLLTIDASSFNFSFPIFCSASEAALKEVI